MKAAVFRRYGTLDELKIEDVEKPTPKDDEVLVKVHAVSINDWDLGLIKGIPFANRTMIGLFKPKQTIVGSDIAGRIEAVGKESERFQVGDHVYGDLSGRWGGFAEYVCAPENALVQKPAPMSFGEAAALPQAGALALQGLLDVGQLQKGQKVLINGAGGGVGTLGGQIAKTYGCELTGVDRGEKLEMLRTLGFDQVIDYTKEDFTKLSDHYDLILDAKTNRAISEYFRALKPGGTYVTVGGETGRLMQVMFFSRLISAMSNKSVRIVLLQTNKDMAYLNTLYEKGKLKPVIDSTYQLSDAVHAMRHYESAMFKGKVIIKVASPSI